MLIPFIDRVAFIQDLREQTIDVPAQECFTKDEVKVEVDGVVYLSVNDSVKASYGITDYRFAAIQLAQTTTRAIIGTLELDTTFQERETISKKVVEVLSKAGTTWGITVHRYEIKNLTPPPTVQGAMEKQVTAEREKKAVVSKSLGERQSDINMSEGLKQELVNKSEGEMRKLINEAEGKAAEILSIASATAESISKMAGAISIKGGYTAIQLEMAKRYLKEFKNLAKKDNKIVLPADINNISEILKGLDIDLVSK